jgi:ABC-2 type transport system ATP-binding protein
MDNQAIRIRGLEKSFRNFKLGPLALSVPKGAIYGLIGPNGAGKTTTIDLIMGMGAKNAGTIEVFGMDHIREEAEVKKRIGYVSPDLQYSAWGKVGKAIRFIRAFYPDWDDAYCADLMKRLNLSTDERIGTLSFGSRTKLALLLALSHRPQLLLLDEPLAGLDAVSKQEVFTELLDAVQDENRTVVISSHDLHDIERFADHVGIIHKGKLLIEGHTDELVAGFCMIDCVSANGVSWPTIPVYEQKHEGNRWRLLAQTTTDAIERLKSSGATDIATSPVTLEELFVGLVKER